MRGLTLLLLCLPMLAFAQDPPAEGSKSRYEAKLLMRALTRGANTPLAWKPAALDGASLKLADGLPVLIAAGTPEQLGARQGQLIGPQMKLLLERYLMRFIRTDSERKRARQIARELAPFILPRHRRELLACAKVAGISEADALLAHTFLDAYKVAFCTTALATGERGPASGPLLARNLDFPSLGIAERATMIKVIKPEGRHAYAHVTWPGMSGVLTGVNARGLTIALMVVHQGTPYRPGMPYTLLFRQLLEECATTEQAVALLRRSRRTTANNLMICDRQGRGVVAELTAESVVLREPGAGLLTCTNHFQPHRVLTGELVPPPSLSLPSSRQRYKTSRQLLEPLDRIDLAALKRALAATANQLTTIQSMVFEPRSLRLHLATGQVPASKAPYRAIELAPLLRPEDGR